MRTVSTSIGGKRIGLAFAASFLWASLGTAQAGTLWYNGDFDGNDALYNAVVPSVQTANVYDDFIVPAGQTWSISDVYSNDLLSTASPVTSAYFEIREGVSPGNGGTLLYLGTDAATTTPTGRSGFGYDEYTVDVTGLTGITLTAGTYWLNVSPVVTSISDISYITTTGGTNAVGMPPGNDGDSYVAGSYYVNQGGYNYEPASDYYVNPDTGLADFSMGVDGIIVASVPEPSTLAMGAIGTLTVLGCAWRGRRNRS